MDKKSAVFIAVSFIILIVMLYFVGIDNIIDALKNANLTLITVTIIVQIATYFLYTIRWNLINSKAGIKVSIKSLIPIIIVGLAVNNITPSGRGGGEPVRAYILSKEHDYDLKDTFATVVADRALTHSRLLSLQQSQSLQQYFILKFPHGLLSSLSLLQLPSLQFLQF